ncbi:outer membrane beta-barrel protein [Vibrio sp. T11.5]|uniref:outer membrane beta-barrel protein n=1 Tax=Vibrio sp. T11.5 TaxID=2998836 RepID=UPI0022CD7220|nr:outer membrane beta-barrel protein [Vibrio sp. T11.5]MDA0119414.1 outer membrane beta-barrel protein [Vibrio sp. T11.5]
MKKTLLVAASAALISMPSLANENYIAVELGLGSYTTSGQDANSDVINDDTGFLSLKAGHYFSDNIRAYGYLQAGAESTIEYQNIFGYTYAKSSITTHEFGAGADYLHNLTDKFYLLAGGNLGIYNSTYEVSEFGLSKDSTNTGLAAGVNLGMGYNFTDNFSMELGYRHSRFFGNDHEVGVIKLSVDASNTGYLNASYSF